MHLHVCQVNATRLGSIVESDYSSLFGASIITAIEGGSCHVLGVHFVSGDSTSEPPNKATRRSRTTDYVDPFSDDLHGNMAHRDLRGNQSPLSAYFPKRC